MSKLTFDGSNKTITVLSGVTTLDIRTDVWTEWVDWQTANPNWALAMRYSGIDPIPNGESGAIFFLINGWKLVLDFTQTAVFGVLYSDNYTTPYWNSSNQALYPAVVSALVNSVVISTPVVEQADPALIAGAILDSQIGTSRPVGSLGEFLIKKVLTIAKFIGLK